MEHFEVATEFDRAGDGGLGCGCVPATFAECAGHVERVFPGIRFDLGCLGEVLGRLLPLTLRYTTPPGDRLQKPDLWMLYEMGRASEAEWLQR